MANKLNRNKITQELLKKGIPFRADVTTEELQNILEKGNTETPKTETSSGITEEDISKIKNIVTGLIEPLHTRITDLETLTDSLTEKIAEVDGEIEKTNTDIAKANTTIKQMLGDIKTLQKALKK